MSTWDEAGSDVYALIIEFATRPVEHRSKITSNKSQALAEGSKVAHVRRRFSFLLYRGYFYSARVIISADREWR